MLPAPENFTLTTSDDVALAVSRWKPDCTPVAKVVLAHGFTANRAKDEIRTLAAALVAAGADLTIHDARGHGESAGKTTIGNLEQLDIAAVVAHVASQDLSDSNANASAEPPQADLPPADPLPAEPPLPLLLIGISMGAIASVNYLISNPKNPVRGLLLISSPAYWRPRPGKSAVIMTFLTRTGLGRRVAERHMGVRIASKIHLPEAPARAVARVSLPIGIIGGKEDMLLGTKAAQRIYEAAAEPKKLALIDGAGHSIGEEAVEACQQMLSWLVEQAKQTG